MRTPEQHAEMVATLKAALEANGLREEDSPPVESATIILNAGGMATLVEISEDGTTTTEMPLPSRFIQDAAQLPEANNDQ